MRRLGDLWPDSPEDVRWRGRVVASAILVAGLLVLSMVPGK